MDENNSNVSCLMFFSFFLFFFSFAFFLMFHAICLNLNGEFWHEHIGDGGCGCRIASPTVTTIALPTVTAVNDGDEGGILSVHEEPSYVTAITTATMKPWQRRQRVGR